MIAVSKETTRRRRRNAETAERIRRHDAEVQAAADAAGLPPHKWLNKLEEAARQEGVSDKAYWHTPKDRER